MAAFAGTLIERSQLITWYTRLNTARAKFNLAAIAVPSATTGTTVDAQEIQALDTALNNVVSQSAGVYSSQHYSKNVTFSPAIGTLIFGTLGDQLNALLSSWDQVCYYNSNYGDYGDNGNNSNYDMNCSYCYSDKNSDVWDNNYMDWGTYNTTCGDNIDLNDNSCTLCMPNS